MFKNILVPVDGSDQSLQSAKVAADLAAKSKGKVHLLHVIRPYAFEYMGMEGKREIPGGATEIGHRIIDKIKQIIADEAIEISSELLYGNPAEVIIEVSKKGFDIIVMGSRGLGGLSGLVLGSVSNQVSNYAQCPVLLTRLAKEERKIVSEIIPEIKRSE